MNIVVACQKSGLNGNSDFQNSQKLEYYKHQQKNQEKIC
jgi:hypothetical protein